jgi:hypothetical protein
MVGRSISAEEIYLSRYSFRIDVNRARIMKYMKNIVCFFILSLSFSPAISAQNYVSKVWVADQGDGTYINPIINADYSDPDVCAV